MTQTNQQPDESVAASTMQSPWVQLRSATFHPFIFNRMVKRASPDAQSGDCVNVYDKNGALFGHGLYNPKSQIALRMLNHDASPIDETFWQTVLNRALDLRHGILRLPESTDAYRLVHAEGDDISGLIVDRYGDVLSVEVFSLGIWRQIETLLPILHPIAGTKHHTISADDLVQKREGFVARPIRSDKLPKSVSVRENGVRFRIQFDVGHKTGFFCDQRDNRLRFAKLCAGCDVLDLCCYSGGFGVYAKTLGRANNVTCVDLDENAVAMTKQNANLNQVRIDAVQADAFTYIRQMQANNRQYDRVVLDPPKLIFSRTDQDEGRKKYRDLNRIAVSLVKPGGVLLTCSCSGSLDRGEFVRLAVDACRQNARTPTILDITGAAADHPISPRCPESAYLKAVWLRVT